MRFLSLCFLLFLPVLSAAEGWPSWFTSKDENSQKWAVMPSYRRNATYGHIFGGRFFIYPTGNTGYYTALSAFTNRDLFFSSTFSYKYWRENGDQLDFILDYDGFSEPYYGEGYQTKPEDRKDIPIHKGHTKLEYVSKIRDSFYGGIFFGFDYRKEKNEKDIKFPEELFFSGGVLLRYDSRSDYFNPTQGEYYQIRSWLLPTALTPVFLEAELKLFFSLVDEYLVLAQRGLAGFTFINPAPYLFRFSLGGPDELRGYRLNRFRGENYYLSQTELRFTPWKFLSLVGFFDLGSADDELFSPAWYSFGGGLRFGLPPDYNKKVRLEASIGEDQYNIVVAFNHPF